MWPTNKFYSSQYRVTFKRVELSKNSLFFTKIIYKYIKIDKRAGQITCRVATLQLTDLTTYVQMVENNYKETHTGLSYFISVSLTMVYLSTKFAVYSKILRDKKIDVKLKYNSNWDKQYYLFYVQSSWRKSLDTASLYKPIKFRESNQSYKGNKWKNFGYVLVWLSVQGPVTLWVYT